LAGLRRLSRSIRNSQKYEQLDYSLIRAVFRLLTSKLKYAILLVSLWGKPTEPPSFRKEEVMSIMDSSMQPSAVASLLK
jgi:hypothetical protein